jgi:enamine deaminase RidA (YjgF/YER057c/UK114 family)
MIVVRKFAVVFVMLFAASLAMAQVKVQHLQQPDRPIATAVWAGDTLYVSGQMASPVSPGDPAKGTQPDYGNTEAQSMSALTKIQQILKEQGLTMGDVVMMHVFMAGDPGNGGKLDFAGMMKSYNKFFGTPEQPKKPSRSAMQVAALAAPWGLVEIEVIAVRSK